MTAPVVPVRAAMADLLGHLNDRRPAGAEPIHLDLPEEPAA